jgi:acyl transferase domain-containing protein
MLQTAERALRSFSYSREETRNWGVFMGINLDFSATNFASRWAIENDAAQAELGEYDRASLADAITPPLNNPRTVGALGGIVASRIAREYNIGGPSHTFSSGENSGLSALEAGMRALQRGEISAALVGAVDLAGDLRNLRTIDALRPFSRKNGSVPFDTSADGAFLGEGAVALVLQGAKKTPCATQSHHRSRQERWPCDADDSGVIKTLLSMLTAAPCNQPGANQASICLTWVCSKLRQRQSREDSIEARRPGSHSACQRNLCRKPFQSNDQLCALTSSKSFIGHTGCAAGLFSLARAAVSLYQQILPRHPRSEKSAARAAKT